MELHLDNIEFKGKRVVGGNLYFQVKDQYFPEENWYEALSADLENWLPQLLSFARKHSDSCLFSFLDGPCCVKLHRQPDGTVVSVCLWNQRTQIKEEINFPYFLGSAVKAVRKFQRALYEREIPFPFAQELTQLTQLKKQFENIT